MHAPWLGTRRVAFVPVVFPPIDSNPPADFSDRVFRRVFYDPDAVTGVDRSLQRYISTVSYGRAALDGSVLEVVVSNTPDTVGAGIDSLPEGHTFDAACIVLLNGGADRGGWAWWHAESRNGITEFARVNLAMGLGGWAMEVMHILCDFADLYNTDPHLGDFDNMAGAGGTHPSTHTKRELAWLGANTMVDQSGFGQQTYDLHAVGLPQPAPPGRTMAVRTPVSNGNSFVIEARLRSDQYERDTFASNGIPSEGVIVYEVADKTEVYLRTPMALSVGDQFSPEEGLTVRVTSAVNGGFRVTITRALPANKRSVPFVRFLPTLLATKLVQDAELIPKFTGNVSGTYVKAQSPQPGTIVNVASTVTMQLAAGPLP